MSVVVEHLFIYEIDTCREGARRKGTSSFDSLIRHVPWLRRRQYSRAGASP